MVMQSNQTDRTNKIKKILIAFNSIHKFPMALIKCGTYAFLTVFTIGCILVMLNNTVLSHLCYSKAEHVQGSYLGRYQEIES